MSQDCFLAHDGSLKSQCIPKARPGGPKAGEIDLAQNPSSSMELIGNPTLPAEVAAIITMKYFCSFKKMF